MKAFDGATRRTRVELNQGFYRVERREEAFNVRAHDHGDLGGRFCLGRTIDCYIEMDEKERFVKFEEAKRRAEALAKEDPQQKLVILDDRYLPRAVVWRSYQGVAPKAAAW